MLKDDLYTLHRISKEENLTFVCEIGLHAGHSIFAGHFPGNPVLPGVCMVQIIKELVAEIFGSSVMLRSAQNIKFLKPVNPLLDSQLKIVLTFRNTEEQMFVNAQVTNDTVNFCSFRGVFSEDTKT